MSTIDFAVVGATSQAGETLVELLEERKFPAGKIYFADTDANAGARIEFNNKSIIVEKISVFDFTKVKLVFFLTDELTAKEYIPRAVDSDCVVIDRSPAFRDQPGVPLIVPEVNKEEINNYTKSKIISIPCAISTQVSMVLQAIREQYSIESVNIATYQSVSGAGKSAAEELASQTAALLNFRDIKTGTFSKQIAFNVIPQVGDVDEDTSATREELKIHDEIKKVLHDNELKVEVSCVRVPVFIGHAAAVSIKTQSYVDIDELKSLLQAKDGITIDTNNDTATPVTEAAGNDEVYVSRIRTQLDDNKGMSFWTVTDNLRKGAALNMLQVAEELITHF